jgi:tetratricopeptide (TPR) repeat protein
MDNAARQRGRAAAVVRLLGTACADSPVLVIVEDVHWADKVTLDYVAALTRSVGSISAVLTLTTRVAGDPLDAAWRGSVQGSPLVTIDLGPLGTKDALALAGGFLSAPSAFAKRCVERSGGNPLFLEQLMRAADEREDGLPASLSSLVLARMDRLPERDRAALRAASVVGQRFPLALVRHLAQMPDYSCDALVAHFLIHPEGEEFLFAHALIRDGVYASLTRVRRSELHRMAAEWYGERDPVLRAEHLDRAEARAAPRAYLDAALAQATALRPERALALADRGAALAGETDDVVALNMLRGRLRRESGEGRPAVDAYEVALAATQRPADRCRALLGIAAGHRLLTGVDAALAALAEAEPLARAHGLTRELAELHYTRGSLHFARGNNAACRDEHGAALACARSIDDPGWEARATSGLADADYADGRMLSALARFRQCIEICNAHGLAREEIPNRTMVGHCRLYLMEFDAGIADMEAARTLAVGIGDHKHGEMFALESQGLLLASCERHADAEPVLERSLVLAETIGARRFQALVLAGLAACSLAAGRLTEGRDRIERSLALSREIGMGFCGPMALGVKARLLDNAKERERCRAEAEALIADGCASHNMINYHRHGIEDALARGEFARGLEHVAALEAYTRGEPLPYCDFLIARARVLVGLASRPEDRALLAELARLRAEAERVRWPIGWTMAASVPR